MDGIGFTSIANQFFAYDLLGLPHIEVSSPSGFSSPPRSRCSRVLESPIAAVSCKALMCSDVTINNYYYRATYEVEVKNSS